MKHELDFAPISSKPSSRLNFVVGYLRFNGGLALAGIGVAAIAALAGDHALRALFTRHPLEALGATVGAAGLLFAARGLAHRSRAGAYAAAAIFAAPCIAGLFGGGVPAETWAIEVLGVAAVASAWGELE